jgi:hypothetical protein
MNHIVKNRGICFLLGGFMLIIPVRGQYLELDFAYAGLEDTEKLLQAYLEPFANILGSDLNAGWYNTARPHSLGGFDVTFSISASWAPPALLTYDVLSLGLNGRLGTAQSIAPTIAGEMDDRPSLSYSEEVDVPDVGMVEVPLVDFTLPDGTGVNFFPTPMGQLTVGLPFGTDVSARFVPMIHLGDFGKIGLWGVGGRHSISQWLPVIKNLKVLDISLQGGFTKVSSDVRVTVEPNLDPDNPVHAPDPQPDLNWNDQFVVQDVKGWTLNLIASQTLSVITFYEGLGYASSVVEMGLEGHYPIPVAIIDENDEPKVSYNRVEDPISLEYKNLNNMRVNVGVRLKLSVLTIHYDYTHTLYSTHSAGIGISFR